MAIEWDQFRKDIRGKVDWIGAARGEYGEYLYRARERFARGEAATVRQVKALYRRVAAQIRSEVEALTPGTLRRSHLTALAGTLEKTAKELNQGMLDAVTKGVRLSVDEAVSGSEEVTQKLLAGTFDTLEIKWMFADINQRAVLSLLSRTRHDGLVLSDRVWRISQNARKSIQRIIEDGVTRGLDSRKMARQLQQYLQPDKWTAFKDETRRRLGVPKDVSMEAMRLAVTEMNNAFHEGTINSYRAIPSARGIYWRLSKSHPLPDVCDDYASHNGNGFWPKGEEPAKPHPWCKCIAVPAMEDPEEFTGRLRAWMQNPASQPDIEMWYNDSARRFLRRPSKVLPLSGGSLGPERIKGYVLYGGRARDVNAYNVGATKIIVPVDLDTNLQRLAVDDIKVEFQKLPQRLQNLINEIQILDYRNPDDLYWEQKYGIKDFRSFATGGEGKIHFYSNSHLTAGHVKKILFQTLAHEAGHNLDQDMGRLAAGALQRFSETTGWMNAANKDAIISGNKWASAYSQKAQSLVEDFADSVASLLIYPTDFERCFPNRTAILKKELGL